MFNLYSCAGLVMLDGVITLCSLSYIASSENEATGATYAYMIRKYPASDRYSHHTVVVSLVNPETIKKVFNSHEAQDDKTTM